MQGQPVQAASEGLSLLYNCSLLFYTEGGSLVVLLNLQKIHTGTLQPLSLATEYVHLPAASTAAAASTTPNTWADHQAKVTEEDRQLLGAHTQPSLLFLLSICYMQSKEGIRNKDCLCDEQVPRDSQITGVTGVCALLLFWLNYS